MSVMNSKIVLRLVKGLLFLSVLALLIVTPGSLFPLVFGKAVFYRVLIELAAVLLAVYYLMILYRREGEDVNELHRRFRALIRNPLVIAVGVFFISALLSSILAPNAYRAFFGTLERGEGFFGLLHFGLFFVMGLLVFNRHEWLKFAKFMLVTVFLLMIWAWIQYLGLAGGMLSLIFSGDRLRQFVNLIGSSSQPGSFTGNAAFLASSIIISLGAAAFVFFFSPKKSFWRYGTAIFTVVAVLTIFITAIRGALLGLLSGVLFLLLYLFFKSIKLRWVSFGLLVVLLAGVVVFWMTRSAPVWQSIPGVERAATVSLENPSVATRLIALGVSWDAFKEKPILGWGLENYNVAYNKHYDPAYAFYAEDWFDRAHNRLADVAVMQGIVGVAAYLSIFAVLFYFLISRKYGRSGLYPFGFLVSFGAVLVAYFVQNLFVFDQVTSYIPFFASLGMMVAFMDKRFSGEEQPSSIPPPKSYLLKVFSAVIIIIVVTYTLYAYNIVPWRQTTRFFGTLDLRVGEKILAASDSFLFPYTFAQMEIRAQFIEVLYNNNVINEEKFEPLVDKALGALEEVVKKEPYEPRNFTRLVESYNERAKDDSAVFPKSEMFIKEALELSPQRQGLLYQLAFVLAGEERYDESIELARSTAALDDRLAKSHYQLGIVLALAADSDKNKGTPLQVVYREEAEKELDVTRRLGRNRLGSPELYVGSDPTSTQYYLFLESDLKNMLILYKTWGKTDKFADVLEVLISFHPSQIDYYYDALTIYRILQDKESIIRNAQKLKALDPTLETDMDIIIDLAEKENWEILNSL